MRLNTKLRLFGFMVAIVLMLSSMSTTSGAPTDTTNNNYQIMSSLDPTHSQISLDAESCLTDNVWPCVGLPGGGLCGTDGHCYTGVSDHNNGIKITSTNSGLTTYISVNAESCLRDNVWPCVGGLPCYSWVCALNEPLPVAPQYQQSIYDLSNY